jgi:DNA invertase Pin-like site-specific DNA recombinase
MKTILYSRVSTREQADSGISLEAQRAKLTAYASLYDLEVVQVIEDAGESAKSLKRPGLQRALAMLRSGEADGLAVVKLDRLTRSVADWQTLIDDHFCEKSGKQLFSVTDSIDTRTAAGRLVLNVLLSVAQWEREATGERTKEALHHKIKNGERVGKVRFGYDLADDNCTLIANHAEQGAIEWMKQLRAEGLTLRQIANALTDRGISTKEGRSGWKHSTVSYILKRAA